MRVFVVGTGRCGTSTFYQACRHIENYTAGHETAARTWTIYPYPDKHIEVAGHLSMLMGRVIYAYPGSFWVHLIRRKEACVRSLASQSQAPLDSFARHWFQVFQLDPLKAAIGFYDCVNANIRTMLNGVEHMTIQTEWAKDKWSEFWERIGAEGDYDASVAEWDRKYNAEGNRGRDNWV